MRGWSSERCAPARRSASISSPARSTPAGGPQASARHRSSSASGRQESSFRRRCRTTSSCFGLQRARSARWSRSRPASRDARLIFRQSASTSGTAGGRIGQHLVVAWPSPPRFRQRPARTPAAALRYDGFLDALREAGIDEEPWTATGDFTFQSGVEAAERSASRQGVGHRARLRQRRHGGGSDARAAPRGPRNPVGDLGHRLRRHADVGNRLAAADDGSAADQVSSPSAPCTCCSSSRVRDAALRMHLPTN